MCGTKGNFKLHKYILIALDIVLLTAGIIALIISINLSDNLKDLEIFLITTYIWLSIALIAITSLVIGCSFFSFWSVIKENYCSILIFTVIMTIISVVSLAAGIYGFTLRSNYKSVVRDSLTETMKKYHPFNGNEETAAWDYLQRTFMCCGLENDQDWKFLDQEKLPLSCCHIPSGVLGDFTCSYDRADPNRFPIGCRYYLSVYVGSQLDNMGAAGLSVAGVLILAVCISFYYARRFKNRAVNRIGRI